MLKLRFTRAKIRIFVLAKIVLLLVIFFVVANFLLPKSFIILSKNNTRKTTTTAAATLQQQKVDFFVLHEANNIEINSSRKILTFTKQIKSHNFKPALERPKLYTIDGLGEFGIEAKLEDLTNEEKSKEKILMREYGINQFISEKISLHRALKDPRPPG